MLYTVLQDLDWWTITHHSVKYDPGIVNYLKAPFYFDKNRLTKVSRGQMYDAYCFTKPYAKVQEKLQSKMFWNEYLPKNGISVPKLNATTNPYKEYDPIDPDREYISKPEFGTAGDGIKIVKGRDVKPSGINCLIQDKIGSCGYDGARSYRIVTTYDGDVLARYEFKNDETITSNISSSKRATAVKHDNVPEIEDIIQKLCKLHVRDFNFCFSIGWDLMVECEDKDPAFPDVYVLEGNWPSGIFGDTINRNDKFIEMVNKKARSFYKIKDL
jgi:glutathione synthase/RimK-type ligase-like ATP-grasp enzyme